MSEGSSIRSDDKSRALSATGAAAKSARITQCAAGIAVINRASIAKPSCNTCIAREKGSRNSRIYPVIPKGIKSRRIEALEKRIVYKIITELETQQFRKYQSEEEYAYLKSFKNIENFNS